MTDGVLAPNEELIDNPDDSTTGPVQLRHVRYDTVLQSWVRIKPITPTGHSRWTGTASVPCPATCPHTSYHWDA